MTRNKLVAIIGGIGSGKSTVLSILNRLGAVTLSADAVNRELLSDKSYIAGLAKIFPRAIIDDCVNKAYLRNIVFNSKEELDKLNSFAHPRILDAIIKKAKMSNTDVFVEMPLLVESDSANIFDTIWLVTSKDSIERAAERDLSTLEEIKKVNACQVDDDIRRNIADVIIENNDDIICLEDKVKKAYYDFIYER